MNRFELALPLEGVLGVHQKTIQLQRKTDTDGEKFAGIPSNHT